MGFSLRLTVVPPPGSRYDRESKKVVIDETIIDMDENDDKRLATILNEIANDIIPGIIMEHDIPSKNIDNKMPILDMKVWIERSSGNIMFQHYEKPTASGNIMHANTAQAVTCRNSVHTQEIMRRLLNSSPLFCRELQNLANAACPTLYKSCLGTELNTEKHDFRSILMTFLQ